MTILRMLKRWLHEMRTLLESASVEVSFDKYDDLIDTEVEDLAAWAASKGRPWKEDAIEAEKERLRQDLRAAMEPILHAVWEAIRGIPEWASKVQIVPVPPHYDGDTHALTTEGKVSTTVDVRVYKSSPRNAPGFVFFGLKEVDDVLDAGDSDFFDDPDVEHDYFALVNELRNPGKARKDGEKILTLYTARPVKDRALYADITSIPSNVFLSTSPDEAEGYAADFGARDVWKIRVKQRYLVLTLDTPRVRNYQVYAKEKQVPIEGTSLYLRAAEG